MCIRADNEHYRMNLDIENQSRWADLSAPTVGSSFVWDIPIHLLREDRSIIGIAWRDYLVTEVTRQDRRGEESYERKEKTVVDGRRDHPGAHPERVRQ